MKSTNTFSIICALSVLIFAHTSAVASTTHNSDLHRVGIATSQNTMDTQNMLSNASVRMDKRLSCMLSNNDKANDRIKSASNGDQFAEQQVC